MKFRHDADFDVMTVGSALLDFIVKVDDSFLGSQKLMKGGMHLVDSSRSEAILAALAGRAMETLPGGSAANAAAGVACLGGRSLFLGTVGDDEYGSLYVSETEKAGVRSRIGVTHALTGHAITFITPDLERTFATHLGAALNLRAANVKEEDIRNSSIIHFEAYLFEMPELKDACLRAMELARSCSTRVSVDLSDPFLVERIRGTLDMVLNRYTDIVFANEEEALAYTGHTGGTALEALGERCAIAAVKLGSRGSLIMEDRHVYQVESVPVKVVNTNGAGDMYAAGVLLGLCRGMDPRDAGRVGSYAAAQVVASPGARYSGKLDARHLGLK